MLQLPVACDGLQTHPAAAEGKKPVGEGWKAWQRVDSELRVSYDKTRGRPRVRDNTHRIASANCIMCVCLHWAGFQKPASLPRAPWRFYHPNEANHGQIMPDHRRSDHSLLCLPPIFGEFCNPRRSWFGMPHGVARYVDRAWQGNM
jgi:hypothetical protein